MANQSPDLARLHKTLAVLLGLRREPVGVRLLKIPLDLEKSAPPRPRAGIPYCAAVAKASRGARFTLAAEDMYCAAGANALRIVEPDEKRLSGAVYEEFGVYRDRAVCKSIAADMVYVSQPNAGAAVAPLKDCELPPDVVIIAAGAKIIMRVVQGYAYHFGQLKNIKMAGMCALCQECTSYPHETGQMNVSVLCAGTRAVGGWGDDELAAGIPFAKMAQVVDGIERTANPMEDATAKTQIQERAQTFGVSLPPLDPHFTYYKGRYGLANAT